MIAGIFHKGSGLGNQLHRYVMARVLALDKGVRFNMVAPELFKGSSFMNLEMTDGYTTMGIRLVAPYHIDELSGKVIPEVKTKIWLEEGNQYYDPEINFVCGNTIIDGEFQDERYFGHRLPEIRKWLKVDRMLMGDNLCVINFRGGEYKYFPDLYLTQDYWDKAIALMKLENPSMVFEVHTDDVEEAKKFFPNFPIIHDIGINWRSIRYAKYLILSNSSFAILPALLNEDVKKILAPRYWARHNTKVWSTPQNYYKCFTYL